MCNCFSDVADHDLFRQKLPNRANSEEMTFNDIYSCANEETAKGPLSAPSTVARDASSMAVSFLNLMSVDDRV